MGAPGDFRKGAGRGGGKGGGKGFSGGKGKGFSSSRGTTAPGRRPPPTPRPQNPSLLPVPTPHPDALAVFAPSSKVVDNIFDTVTPSTEPPESDISDSDGGDVLDLFAERNTGVQDTSPTMSFREVDFKPFAHAVNYYYGQQLATGHDDRVPQWATWMGGDVLLLSALIVRYAKKFCDIVEAMLTTGETLNDSGKITAASNVKVDLFSHVITYYNEIVRAGASVVEKEVTSGLHDNLITRSLTDTMVETRGGTFGPQYTDVVLVAHVTGVTTVTTLNVPSRSRHLYARMVAQDTVSAEVGTFVLGHDAFVSQLEDQGGEFHEITKRGQYSITIRDRYVTYGGVHMLSFNLAPGTTLPDGSNLLTAIGNAYYLKVGGPNGSTRSVPFTVQQGGLSAGTVIIRAFVGARDEIPHSIINSTLTYDDTTRCIESVRDSVIRLLVSVFRQYEKISTSPRRRGAIEVQSGLGSTFPANVVSLLGNAVSGEDLSDYVVAVSGYMDGNTHLSRLARFIDDAASGKEGFREDHSPPLIALLGLHAAAVIYKKIRDHVHTEDASTARILKMVNSLPVPERAMRINWLVRSSAEVQMARFVEDRRREEFSSTVHAEAILMSLTSKPLEPRGVADAPPADTPYLPPFSVRDHRFSTEIREHHAGFNMGRFTSALAHTIPILRPFI